MPADREVAGSIISRDGINIQEAGPAFALQMASPWRGLDGNSHVPKRDFTRLSLISRCVVNRLTLE